MDIKELDEILATLKKHGVREAMLNPDGNVISINFGHKQYGLVTPLKREFDYEAQQETKQPTRESDIDLALHPPEDVRHPVDDGKE